jgi:hypothetical protein
VKRYLVIIINMRMRFFPDMHFLRDEWYDDLLADIIRWLYYTCQQEPQ